MFLQLTVDASKIFKLLSFRFQYCIIFDYYDPKLELDYLVNKLFAFVNILVLAALAFSTLFETAVGRI